MQLLAAVQVVTDRPLQPGLAAPRPVGLLVGESLRGAHGPVGATAHLLGQVADDVVEASSGYGGHLGGGGCPVDPQAAALEGVEHLQPGPRGPEGGVAVLAAAAPAVAPERGEEGHARRGQDHGRGRDGGQRGDPVGSRSGTGQGTGWRQCVRAGLPSSRDGIGVRRGQGGGGDLGRLGWRRGDGGGGGRGGVGHHPADAGHPYLRPGPGVPVTTRAGTPR